MRVAKTGVIGKGAERRWAKRGWGAERKANGPHGPRLQIISEGAGRKGR